ncbi:MAG: hypothetical protein GY839_01820 [candidate division Zixibacteria bacterium]|nr:hypothetical protein [candidate division Zixibacteria bacterium]
MNTEKTIASILKNGGLVMAAVFAIAIVSGIMGLNSARLMTQIGIICAIAIPAVGVAAAMILLLKNTETKYGICAIILLILLIVTVAWRMFI